MTSAGTDTAPSQPRPAAQAHAHAAPRASRHGPPTPTRTCCDEQGKHRCQDEPPCERGVTDRADTQVHQRTPAGPRARCRRQAQELLPPCRACQQRDRPRRKQDHRHGGRAVPTATILPAARWDPRPPTIKAPSASPIATTNVSAAPTGTSDVRRASSTPNPSARPQSVVLHRGSALLPVTAEAGSRTKGSGSLSVPDPGPAGPARAARRRPTIHGHAAYVSNASHRPLAKAS